MSVRKEELYPTDRRLAKQEIKDRYRRVMIEGGCEVPADAESIKKAVDEGCRKMQEELEFYQRTKKC